MGCYCAWYISGHDGGKRSRTCNIGARPIDLVYWVSGRHVELRAPPLSPNEQNTIIKVIALFSRVNCPKVVCSLGVSPFARFSL